MNDTVGEKILVVDDEAVLRGLLEKVLTEWGYTVLTASDGQEALPIAVTEQPDVILMDIMMPNLNGIETCIRLRERPTTRNIRIIFLTAYGTKEHRDACIKAGADDFLTKPIMIPELLVRVAAMIKVKDIADPIERKKAYDFHMEYLRTETLRS